MDGVIMLLLGAGIGFAASHFATRKQIEKLTQGRGPANLPPPGQPPTKAPDPNELAAVGPGGILVLPPFGRTPKAVEVTVRERHRFNSSDGRWFELVGDYGRRVVLLEWTKTGTAYQLRAGYADENPKLDAIGLYEANLQKFADQKRGSFRWDDTQWSFEWHGELDYFPGDGKMREGYTVYQFISTAADRWLTIARRENTKDWEISVVWRVDASRVEVIEAGRLG